MIYTPSERTYIGGLPQNKIYNYSKWCPQVNKNATLKKQKTTEKEANKV